VGEISKQEFSSYMKMMRDKLLKRWDFAVFVYLLVNMWLINTSNISKEDVGEDELVWGLVYFV
jgi:hypothetical protein